MNYLAQLIEAKRKTLDVALFHHECLDSDCPASIREDHVKHVNKARRALNKAIKENESA